MEAVKAEAVSTEQPRLDLLTARALEIVTGNLRRFDNGLSDAHINELRMMLLGMSEQARGKRNGRIAYSLGCGLGKTQGVVALCAAIHELPSKLSVAVSAAQVEALCQLKRDMMSNGVPEAKIGLIHSYGSKASLPPTHANDQRQFQLVSHQRVKGGRTKLEEYAIYKGKPRSLLIYDESLFVSEPTVLKTMGLEKALGWLKPELQRRDSATKERAFCYLAAVIEAIKVELARQHRTKTKAAPVELEPLTVDDMRGFKAALGDDPEVEPLKRLIEMAQERLQVVWTTHCEGLVTYDIVVPAELNNIAILDASFPIRALEQLDTSIVEGLPEDRPPVKTYEQVTIHHLKTASGRGSVTDDFTNKNGSRFLLELAHLVKEIIPADEGVLLFTFKPRPSRDKLGRRREAVDFEQRIKTALRESGVDIEATVIDHAGNSRPRFAFTTWGNETSTSHFAYCRHVVFAGVLHRDHLDLASYLVGQRDDLWAHVDQKRLAELMRSEVAHCIYQAIMRAAARIVELINGNALAKRMDVWLPYSKVGTIKPLLDEVMPRVKWVKWTGKYVTERETKQNLLGDLIQEALASLPAEQTKITVRAMWKLRPEFVGFPPRTRNRTLQDMLDDPAEVFLWVKEGRSLIRDNMFSDTFEEAQQPQAKVRGHEAM